MTSANRLLVFAFLGLWAAGSSIMADEPKLDQFGDQLPRGALARLGTMRLRVGGAVAFHPNGGQLAVISSHGDVAIWESKSGRASPESPSDSSFRVAYSDDGERLLSIDGNTIVVWDTMQGRRICSIQGFSPRLPTLDLSNDGTKLAAITRESAIQTWRITDHAAEPLFRIEGIYDQVKFGPRSRLIFAADAHRLFRLDGATGKRLAQWYAQIGRLTDFDVSPDGSRIVSAGDDGVISLWETESGRQRWSMKNAHLQPNGQYAAVTCVRFSPDGKTIATTGADDVVRFWDVATHEPVRAFQGNGKRHVQWSPDGRRLATFRLRGSDGVRIRDAIAGNDSPYLPGHLDYAEQIFFFDDGKLAVTAGFNDDSVIVWQVATGNVVHHFRDTAARQLTPLPGANRMIAAGNDRLALYDVKKGVVRELAVATATARPRDWSLSVSSDGRRMVTANRSNRAVIRDGRNTMVESWRLATWDLASEKKLASQWLDDQPQGIRLSPDGMTILESRALQAKSADDRAAAAVFVQLSARPFEDPAKKTILWERFLEGRATAHVEALDISPNGRLVAIALGNVGVMVVELGTGKVLQTWSVAVRSSFSVAFTANGKFVVAGKDGEHRWEVSSGKAVPPIDADAQHNVSIMSPDARLLATGNRQGTVTIWDMVSGHRLFDLQGHFAAVRRLAFSPDGKLLVSSASDSQTLVWSLDSAHWPRAEASTAPAPLEQLWNDLGVRNAAVAYAAAAGLIARPSASIELLANKIDAKTTLPAHPPYHSAVELRAHRAAYVLEQIGTKEATEIRRRIYYPRLFAKIIDTQQKRVDAFGAPLAEGEVLRLGTGRYYVPGYGENVRLALSPDGLQAAIVVNEDLLNPFGSRGRWPTPVTLMDTRTGGVVKTFTIPDRRVSTMSYLPGGNTLVCAAGHTVWLMDVATGRIRKQWPTHRTTIQRLALSRDGNVTFVAHETGEFEVYETETGKPLGAEKLEGQLISIKGAGANAVLIIQMDDGARQVYIWNTEKRVWLRTIKISANSTCAISFDGSTYAVANSNGAIELRRADDDTLQHKIELDPNEFPLQKHRALEFTPDGKHLIVQFDGAVSMVDVVRGRPGPKIGFDRTQRLAISADGRFAASIESYRLNIRELATGRGLHNHVLARSEIGPPCTSADGATLLRPYSRQWYICNPNSLQPLAAIPFIGRPAELSSDGRFCITTAHDFGQYCVSEVVTGMQVSSLPRASYRFRPRFVEGGRRLMSDYDRDNIAVVDLLSGQPIQSWQNNDAFGKTPVISPAGRLVAVADRRDKELSIVDTSSGKYLWSIDTEQRRWMVPQFSTDGRCLILAGEQKNSFAIYDAANGTLIESVALPESAAKVLAVSPRLMTFIAADSSKKMCVYELASRQLVAQYDAGWLGAVRYLDDDRHLVVRPNTDQATVWDLATLAAPRNAGESAPAQLQRLWPDLIGNDAAPAFAAGWAFVLAGEDGIAVLRAKLLERQVDEPGIRRLVAQLDDDDFRKREMAHQALVAIGMPVVKHLNEFVTSNSSTEIKARSASIKHEVTRGETSLRWRRAQWIAQQITGESSADIAALTRTSE